MSGQKSFLLVANAYSFGNNESKGTESRKAPRRDLRKCVFDIIKLRGGTLKDFSPISQNKIFSSRKEGGNEDCSSGPFFFFLPV